MNRVKSVFIGMYPMIAMGIMGWSAWRLYATRDAIAWIGPLLTVVPFMMFLSRVMMLRDVARTSGSFPGMNALAWTGVSVSVYAAFGRDARGDALPLALAVVGAMAFLAYSVWYSRFGRTASAKLAVGSTLPELALKRADGGAFDTRILRGKPAIIFFYRGNWCPLCMAQVKEVAARYREIADLGARVLLVSPQPHENTAALARRFDVPFDFLTDEGNGAARLLDIEMKNGLPIGMGMLGYDADTVFPTVIVLDGAGVIRWVDQTDNYRVRPEPETFLPMVRELATADVTT